MEPVEEASQDAPAMLPERWEPVPLRELRPMPQR